MARRLSNPFLNDFKEEAGLLHEVLKEVQQDGMSLDFHIRKEEVHIYYRGGRILAIKPSRNNKYQFTFNHNYFGKDHSVALPGEIVEDVTHVRDWVRTFPMLKRAIDRHKCARENTEREFQQIVSRENTYSRISNTSDYFVVDIEYCPSNMGKGKRTKFDMLGILWPRTRRANAHNFEPKLALFEMKYGDKALTGTSGLIDHLGKTLAFAETPGVLQDLKEEVLTLFQQKRELGLVRFGANKQFGALKKLSNNKPQFVFIFANRNPRAPDLEKVLNNDLFLKKSIELSNYMDICFAVASFFGYGLYEDCMFTLDEFKKYLKSQSLRNLSRE